jgi:DNA-binding response OmpR family regulator
MKAAAAQDSMLADQAVSQDEPPIAASTQQLNVLLVEDDAADASLILRAIHDHPNVLSANAMAEPLLALREIEEGRLKPDLVLLDLHMPRVDGFEFLKGLRRIPGQLSVPVVFLTNSEINKDVLEYMRSSASLYVVKPDSYVELRIRIDWVVQRAISGGWSD